MESDSTPNANAAIAKGTSGQTQTDQIANAIRPLMEMSQLSRLRAAFNTPSQDQAHSDQASPTAYPISS